MFAALALPGTPTPSRAQEAAKPPESKSLLLFRSELGILQSYMRGDSRDAYQRIHELVEESKGDFFPERVSLPVLNAAANENNDFSAYAADLSRWCERFRLHRLQYYRYQALARKGAISESEKAAELLNAVSNYYVLGPLSNERGQGFEELQEPEQILALDREYRGKDGIVCRYRPIPCVATDGTVDLRATLRPNTEATAFLLTAVKFDSSMPKEDHVTVDIAVASDGPWKLYSASVNSNLNPTGFSLVTSSEAEHPYGFDQYHTIRDGTPGWHLFLLKCGSTDQNWRTRLRIWGQCSHVKSLKELNEVVAGPIETNVFLGGWNRNIIPSDWDQLREAIEDVFEPSKDVNIGFAKKVLTEFLEKHAARVKKEKLVADDFKAERAVLTFLLAEASKSTSRVASGKEENKRRELLEQVLKLDPKAARAALELAKYYSGTFRNPTEADRYAKMAVELAPKWVEARVFAARVATMKGLDGEVERELNALLKEYPNHPSVLRFAGYYRGLRGDYVGSDELFKRCLEKGDFTDEYCRERLFTRAVERNDTQAALKYAGETRQLNPFDLASSEGLIQLFLATGDLERAMAECERALNICPREDNFLARKGEIYMRMAAREPAKAADLKVKAIAAYREAIQCNPNREDLVHYLEFLAQEKPEWEVKLQENIEARIAEALEKPVDGNDPYRVVYRDEITVVNDDGTKSIYFQYAYRICNDDGREVLQELGAPAYSDQVGRCVGARVYRRDGSTEEGRRVESQAMLPPLDVGDIVAVRYRVSDTAQSFFGDFFGAIETLGDNVPVDEVRLVYVLPKARKFYEYGVNGAPKAERREEGDKAIWTFSAKGLARVPREPSQLPLTQMVPTVQVSTYENWKDFGRWYYNLIKKQLEPTPEMKAKVAALIEGKTTERDKARAIYNWVVTNIRYNADWHFGVHGYKPFSAGAIFERCIGDCKDKAIVICTMLGVAGVKAYPVLIRLADSSEPRGREDITLPMPHHFNHAIAYIEYTDGKGQFVDGTATFNGFEELPGGDAGAHVVIVRPEGGVQTQIPTPTPAQNAAIEEASLEFLGNGKVKLSVKLTATGDRASFLRAIYLQSGTRATQIENQWARHKPGAKVVKVEANDLANIDVTPEVKYEIEIPDAYSTDAQGNIEIAAALNPLLFAKGMAAATARRTDIAMNEPYQWQSTLRIKLPEGRSLEKAASFLSGTQSVTLAVNVEVIDREIVITRKYSSGGGVISAADYPKLREMMLAHDRAEAAKLRIVKE